MTRGDNIWSPAPFLSKDYRSPFYHPETNKSNDIRDDDGHSFLIILKIFADLPLSSRDVQVRWRARLFSVNQRRSSHVACRGALYGSPHTFQRQKCLQSLHAFKGDNDPHLHFEDDNVFSHCMLSKATISSSTFRRRQCLQSLHAFKRRQCLHLHFEDDNVFSHCMPSKGDNFFICISKTTMSSPMLRRTQRPLFVHFKKKSENENENELNEKKRSNFNVFMPSRVLLLGFTLVAGRVKIQLEQN